MLPKNGPDILVFPHLVSLIALLCALVLMFLAGRLAFAGERAFRCAGTNVDPGKPALRQIFLSRSPSEAGVNAGDVRR